MTMYENIDIFKDKLLEEFKGNIKCIILTGSYSRGEQTADSDVDIWIFFDKITLKQVKKVGAIIQDLNCKVKINPQCTTLEEGLADYFTREYSSIQYLTDGIILYGSLPNIDTSKAAFEFRSKSLAAYIIMGIRHYLCTSELESVLIRKKLKKRILKPTMWAIRYKYAAQIGIYYKSLEEIKQVCTKEELSAINVFQDFLGGRGNSYSGKVEMILDEIYSLCEKLMI